MTPTQVYDNNEYELLAQLKTNVTMIQENCDDSQYTESRLPNLEYDARLLYNYALHIPYNDELFQVSEILKEDVMQFKKQYEIGKANTTYCTFKTRVILEKIRDTMDVVGSKPRG